MSLFDDEDLFDLNQKATKEDAAAIASLASKANLEEVTGLKRSTSVDPEESIVVTKIPRRRRGVATTIQDTFSTEVAKEAPEVTTASAVDNSASENPTAQPLAAPLVITHQVRHEVAVPEGYDYVPISQHIPLADPARIYPFTLDPFQRCAISCIERNESVLVSAHTSAGKTVVAEYAIAMSLRHKQRVIYTSPIKALSNQKYRELLADFGDVGLMTGDVTINPTASCLVMTTEILRSMLYRGSEVMREVAWVVYDEVHYMRDKERGVVWEETLILLPDKVHYVFLSATIPNAKQFVDWITDIHEQVCHVVYTDYRPTPLQHYLFPAGGDGIHLAVDEKGNFREDNFLKALSVLQDSSDPKEIALGANSKKRRKPTGKGPSDLYKIIKMILAKNLHPVIVFSFSKRDCESYALQMSKIDFNTEQERESVENIFINAIESLSEDDRKLPQIENILPLLKRGIGIHHSGLLPILKEVIEILFQEGLLKVLFATETFSIGLNMPAKTVVFTSARKFDGKDFRWVSSGEYIQMSGRAGRRGLDDRGIVILMLDEKMDPPAAKQMLKGQADALNSAFHLKYNMVLNLLRVEGISPEFMLERSFFQFQNNARLPWLEVKEEELKKQRNAIQVEDEAIIGEYYEFKKQLETLKEDMRQVFIQPAYLVPFLQGGRLIQVESEGDNFGWGCVLNLQRKSVPAKMKEGVILEPQSVQYLVDVLLHCSKRDSDSTARPKPCTVGEKGEMIVVPIVLNAVHQISSVRIVVPKDVRPLDQRQNVYKTIQEVKKRFPSGLPLLDPIQDMGIKDEGFKKLIKKTELLEERLKANPLYGSSRLDSLYAVYNEKMELTEQIKTLRRQIRSSTAVLHMDELKCRKRVLRRLGYTTQEDVIEMKGRVACEISSGDELLLTEMIFTGAFNELTVEQTVSLLSCFVFQEKSEETVRLREELAAPLRMMQDLARRIAKVSIEAKLTLDEEAYVQSFRSELMDVVYAWCQGAKFSDICKMTDVFEGSIIRAMRRLEELLRQMCQAAKTIGNTSLEVKFAEGITKIKRDIVFAASLYL